MRKRTTVKNYGKYYEAILVCADWHKGFCDAVSKGLRNGYGIKVETICYAQMVNPTKEVLHMLSTSYYVIFMLSDGVVETSLRATDHPFLKTYAFVREKNPLAIACATLDDYVVSDGLAYPDFMSDFDNMHRKQFYTYSVTHVTGDLAKEIRRYYPRETKAGLSIKHRCDSVAYYQYVKKYAEPDKISFVAAVLLVVGLGGFMVSGMNYVDICVFYNLFFSFLFGVFYYKRYQRTTIRNNAGIECVYESEGYQKRYKDMPNTEVPRRVRTMRAIVATNKTNALMKMGFAFAGWLLYIILELGVMGDASWTVELLVLSYILAYAKWMYVTWLGIQPVATYLECKWALEKWPPRGSVLDIAELGYEVSSLDIAELGYEVSSKVKKIRGVILAIAAVLGIGFMFTMSPMTR